ncbi:hypothetical protein [Tautonia rosea]|uniref:hypothetical protein n=1 Tax=Tautonia rosea TaxID=2728037 RepID=UPI001475E96D|nr:hypothetical protein [Tautonia rosea]
MSQGLDSEQSSLGSDRPVSSQLGQRDRYFAVAERHSGSHTLGSLITGIRRNLGYERYPSRVRNAFSGKIGDWAETNETLFQGPPSDEAIETFTQRETAFFRTQGFGTALFGSVLSQDDRAELLRTQRDHPQAFGIVASNILHRKFPPPDEPFSGIGMPPGNP